MDTTRNYKRYTKYEVWIDDKQIAEKINSIQEAKKIAETFKTKQKNIFIKEISVYEKIFKLSDLYVDKLRDYIKSQNPKEEEENKIDNLNFYLSYTKHINKIIDELYNEIKNNEYKDLIEFDQAIWDSIEDVYCKPEENKKIILQFLKQEYKNDKILKEDLERVEHDKNGVIENLSFELISNILFNKLEEEFHINNFDELFNNN